jgi:hypothetical protein
MDLKVQTVVVMLMMAALSFFIYVFMIPAQMVGAQLDETVAQLAARIENTVGATTAQFNNNTEIPGTAVRTLLADANANNLAIFVQTRAGQGLVVNYGPQLRNPVTTMMTIAAGGSTRNANLTDFERNFVITAHDLFAAERAAGNGIMSEPRANTGIQATIQDGWALPPRQVMGTQSMNVQGQGGGNLEPILMGQPEGNNHALATYRNLVGATAANIDGSLWSDPVLFFWDVTLPNANGAANMGRTFSNSGILYTPGIRRTNMPMNTNLSFAQQQGSPFFINPTSLFHTTFILDTTGSIIGIYVEEHGVDARTAFLAAAQQAEGFIAQATQFAGLNDPGPQ